MGTVALIGLGSNLGDRKAHLDAAVAGLASVAGTEVRAVSSYHETTPVGGPQGQGTFLNAAAALETNLSPEPLLRALQTIENQEGRVRSERWGARSLDLDLLLFGQQTIRIAGVERAKPAVLEVPHPWLPFRRFVLAPLAEIAPGAVDPVTRCTVSALLANVDRRPSSVVIDDRLGVFGDHLYGEVVAALNDETQAANLSAERWLISRGGFDLILAETNAIDDKLPHPTFVVADRFPDSVRGCGCPILMIDPSDLTAAVSKVLTACAAARSG